MAELVLAALLLLAGGAIRGIFLYSGSSVMPPPYLIEFL